MSVSAVSTSGENIEFIMSLIMISMLKLIIINYNMYELICNKYILYNGLSNYTRNEMNKFCIGFIIYHEKWTL
jgi:hypothetical protein